jgi:hypothetical protein
MRKPLRLRGRSQAAVFVVLMHVVDLSVAVL